MLFLNSKRVEMGDFSEGSLGCVTNHYPQQCSQHPLHLLPGQCNMSSWWFWMEWLGVGRRRESLGAQVISPHGTKIEDTTNPWRCFITLLFLTSFSKNSQWKQWNHFPFLHNNSGLSNIFIGLVPIPIPVINTNVLHDVYACLLNNFHKWQ